MYKLPKIEEFLSHHYEKQLWLGRNVLDPSYSWKNIDTALFGWNPTDDNLRLYQDGLVPMSSYVKQIDDFGIYRFRIIKDQLYRRMNQGATLVLNRLELKCPRIAELNQELANFIGERIASNGYACFGGKSAFDLHWDTHDVFAVQLIGRKKWTLYEPSIALPLPGQNSKNRKHECPNEPVLETILNSGDVLYIPRGWWHETESFPNEETFHIAAGVHVPKVIDYAAWLCHRVMSRHLSSRQSIKWESTNFDIKDFVVSFEQEIRNPENIGYFKKSIAETAMYDTSFNFGGLKQDSPLIRPKKILLNSPYRQDLASGTVTCNGFNINIDKISGAVLSKFLDATPDEIQKATDQEMRFLIDLLRLDVISMH